MTQKNKIVVKIGTRCLADHCDVQERKVLDVHHITPVAMRGTDRLDNLTVLCANHHRLASKGKVVFKAVTEVLNTDEIAQLSNDLKLKKRESSRRLLGDEPIMEMKIPKLRF